MITNNFKNLCATLLESSLAYIGLLPVVDYRNRTWYASTHIGADNYYPVGPLVYAREYDYSPGISIGSGTRAESASDYELQTPIFNGYTMTIDKSLGLDSGNPYLEFTISIENTDSNSIMVSEIGYFQLVAVTQEQNVTDPYSRSANLMLDRTVLSTPVTIAAGETETIVYRLKTTLSSAS